jgi:hypothetical protein
VKALLALVVLAACATETEPAPDAALLVAPDACVREATGDCCTLLPDDTAVAECAARDVPPGACGVYVCWFTDCSRQLVNFCAPD